MPELLAGVDIGGTKTAVCVGTADMQVLHREEFDTHAGRGFEAVYGDLCACLAETLQNHPGVRRIGVSVGGPVNAARGMVCSPPHLPGWDDVPLARLLEGRFHRPTALEHDAKAGALAEWRFGAGRGARHLAFLTLGTGLGAGLVLDGRLYRGAGEGAGELGHWRVRPDGPPLYGKSGSLEGYASGAGIAALATLRDPGRFPHGTTARDVDRLARAGDESALAVLAESGERLGHSLALLIDLLALEVVVLGNLARRLHPVFLGRALETARAEALPGHFARCRIVPAALGERLGDVAALCVALEEVRHP